MLRSVLDGEAGPRQDVVLLNAGAAIAAGGLSEDIAGGVEKAREAIGSGKAKEKLQGLIEVSSG